MLKIVHLFNFHKGSRYPLMISEGLIDHPEIEASFAMPVISFGKKLCQADTNLAESLMESDYIFRPNDEHFGITNVDDFLDENNLWSKVIYYDFKDSYQIDEHRLNTCHTYIKRSWTKGFDRIDMQYELKSILPMDYGLLNEYLSIPLPPNKDIDLSCLFLADPLIGKRRYNVVSELEKSKVYFNNPQIGSITSGAAIGRRAIFDQIDNNPFISYMSVLKRSKIVFTAFPDDHDGDSRTWEAFSSGAMVFMDKTTIPSPHPFIHKRDCFIYDARNLESIKEAIEMARYYLNHENERLKIALNGYKKALTHHKPIDRMNYILKWVLAENRTITNHVTI